MAAVMDFIKSVPLGELRRLVTLKENQDHIETLMENRDKLLNEARLIQNQIDELMHLGSSQTRKKRKGPSVKALCIEALKGKKSGLTAAEVKNTILMQNPHRNNRTFYNQVFIALTRSPSFKKQKNGRFNLTGK